MSNYRNVRIASEIMREVQDILYRQVNDPRVQGISIASVDVTGDLSQAKIYYNLLSNLSGDETTAQSGLEKATGLIKRELGKRIKLYKMPELIFIHDTSLQYGEKIDELIRNLHKSN